MHCTGMNAEENSIAVISYSNMFVFALMIDTASSLDVDKSCENTPYSIMYQTNCSAMHAEENRVAIIFQVLIFTSLRYIRCCDVSGYCIQPHCVCLWTETMVCNFYASGPRML